jgi:hypothetical protein
MTSRKNKHNLNVLRKSHFEIFFISQIMFLFFELIKPIKLYETILILFNFKTLARQ